MSDLNDALRKTLIDRNTLEIIHQRVNKVCENPPSTACVNILLNGTYALKYAILKEIICLSTNASEQDVAWYILVNGIEKEYEKMAKAGMILDEKSNSV